MQFFWKHLHNNKGDENVSKLIWIVIAFVIGALLLSTMSVAFRTDGTGAISGWLNSSLENWFGEADGRDGFVSGGTGGSGPSADPEGNEKTELDGIILVHDASKGILTTDPSITSTNGIQGNGGKESNYTQMFSASTISLEAISEFDSKTASS